MRIKLHSGVFLIEGAGGSRINLNNLLIVVLLAEYATRYEGIDTTIRSTSMGVSTTASASHAAGSLPLR